MLLKNRIVAKKCTDIEQIRRDTINNKPVKDNIATKNWDYNVNSIAYSEFQSLTKIFLKRDNSDRSLTPPSANPTPAVFIK